jgi:spermidine/putrescine transport system ATP-binding protein
MSDRVAVMNAGRFEQVDTPRGLYDSPASRFIAGFVGESNQFPARIEAADEERVRVRTETGLQLQAIPMQPMEGTECRLFIRPESIILQPDESLQGINRFTLQVKTILFDGSNTKMLASVGESGREIMVSLPQNRQFAHIGAGDRVTAGVHVDACRCYPT